MMIGRLQTAEYHRQQTFCFLPIHHTNICDKVRIQHSDLTASLLSLAQGPRLCFSGKKTLLASLRTSLSRFGHWAAVGLACEALDRKKKGCPGSLLLCH